MKESKVPKIRYPIKQRAVMKAKMAAMKSPTLLTVVHNVHRTVIEDIKPITEIPDGYNPRRAASCATAKYASLYGLKMLLSGIRKNGWMT